MIHKYHVYESRVIMNKLISYSSMNIDRPQVNLIFYFLSVMCTSCHTQLSTSAKALMMHKIHYQYNMTNQLNSRNF